MIIAPRTPVNIISSNVPVVEAGIAVWDSSATYSVDDIVQSSVTNSIYKAILAVPAGTDPSVDAGNNAGIGTYWFKEGSTNYARAFDELTSSKCTNASQINYKFSVSDVDLFMLDGVSADTVRIVVTDEATNTVIFDNTDDLTSREVYDWSDWIYAPIDRASSYFKLLPMAYNSTIEVWINGVGTVDVGHIAYGRSRGFGLTLASPKPVTSMRGVTTKSRDKWGNIITRKKARYKRMTINVTIKSTSVDMIQNRLESIVDMPCIFVGDESEGGYKSLLIYGELKDHDMPIGITKTQYQLDVEGYI